MNGEYERPKHQNESFTAAYCPRLAIKLTLRFDGFSDLYHCRTRGGEETFA
jgi:hypothetical protein